MDKRGGGSIRIFRRKIFVSQCRTFPEGVESFSVSLLSGIEKDCIRGGSIKTFRGKIFVSKSQKKLVGEHFRVSLILGIENFFVSEGYVTIMDFCRSFFVSQCRKIS